MATKIKLIITIINNCDITTGVKFKYGAIFNLKTNFKVNRAVISSLSESARARNELRPKSD